MRIDLHIHTFPRSACSHLGLSELTEAANHRKLDGICLTEHQVVWSLEEAEKFAADAKIKVFRETSLPPIRAIFSFLDLMKISRSF